MDSGEGISKINKSFKGLFKGRGGLSIILRNISWLIFDRFFKMSVALFIGSWVARYLGPDQFGLLSYAQALVTLVLPFALLGLKSIVVRNLVLNSVSSAATMGTGFCMMGLSSILGLSATCLAASLLRSDDGFFLLIVFIWSLSLLFKPSDMVKYWFEAQVQSGPVIKVEMAVVAISAMIKVILILKGISLLWFAALHAFEVLLLAVGLLALYTKKVGSIRSWRVDLRRAKLLMSESWPLVLSGVAVVVYMQVDKVMLGSMINDGSVGLYAASSRLSVVWNFIPTTVTASVFPAILRSKARDKHVYQQRIQGLLSGLAVIALSMALLISFAAPWIITVLFGDEYAVSAEVLSVHIWGAVFAFLGVGASRWFLAEQLQKLIFYRTFGGAILNVVLNIMWIPKYGIVGAAWATVFSQALASVLFNGLLPQTRVLFYMQMRALFLLDVRYFVTLLNCRRKSSSSSG
jgi:PST family polysaccharide transporter